MDSAAISQYIKSSAARGNSLAGALNQQAIDQVPRLLSMVTLPDTAGSRTVLDTATQSALACELF